MFTRVHKRHWYRTITLSSDTPPHSPPTDPLTSAGTEQPHTHIHACTRTHTHAHRSATSDEHLFLLIQRDKIKQNKKKNSTTIQSCSICKQVEATWLVASSDTVMIKAMKCGRLLHCYNSIFYLNAVFLFVFLNTISADESDFFFFFFLKQVVVRISMLYLVRRLNIVRHGRK